MFKSFYNWGERWYECTPIMDKVEGGHSSVFDLTGKLERNTSSFLTFACEPRPEEFKGNKVKVENTYEMESPNKFSTEKVKMVIETILNNSLLDRTYDGGECVMLTKHLTEDIKAKVKELNFKRYKIICQVIIGEKEHGVNISSRSLWDEERDDYAAGVFENHSLYAVGMVYGVYYE